MKGATALITVDVEVVVPRRQPSYGMD